MYKTEKLIYKIWKIILMLVIFFKCSVFDSKFLDNYQFTMNTRQETLCSTGKIMMVLFLIGFKCLKI